jgi:3D (Asp-Asp-Asp) domain-containing protein
MKLNTVTIIEAVKGLRDKDDFKLILVKVKRAPNLNFWETSPYKTRPNLKFVSALRAFRVSYGERVVVGLFIFIYMLPWAFPQYSVSAAGLPFVQPESGTLPTTEFREPDEVRWVTVTAYSSTPDQTDSTPFNTATGEHVYWGGVAANSLAINSRVRFSGYHGDATFRVNDRMHRRFSDRVDIWFPTRAEATAWGKRRVEVEIWHY